MPTASDQPSVWTPEFISCIVYRVIMVVVSIAFIWKKYRRPARQIDEEQLIGVILPTYNNSSRRPRPVNRHIRSNPTHPNRAQTLRQVISAHLEDVIQSALGIDDHDINIDMRRTSSGSPQSRSSIAVAAGQSLDNVRLNIELEDVGLRHRSADGTSENKKGSQHENSKHKA